MLAELGNYVRNLSHEPSPFPSEESTACSYNNLKSELPITQFPDGQAISIDILESYDIIHLPHTGSLITAANGKISTNVAAVHQSLVLGQDLYQSPPEGSGLSPDDKIPFVYHNGALLDDQLREQIIQNAGQFFYYGDSTDWGTKVERYIYEECPMPLLWLTKSVTDALYRLDAYTGGKILDENGRLVSDIANKVTLINAESGAGEVLAHHDRNKGRMHTFTLTDSLTNEPSGFIARMFGITQTDTKGGACAASGKAINEAEIRAASRKNSAEIFVTMTSYGGPTEETREVFEMAGIKMSDTLPYLYNLQRGYTEAPAASANIFVTRRFAEQYGLPLQDARLIRSVSVQGQNVFGVDEKIPKETYREGFEILAAYYPREYAGTMVFATHGVNTIGWFFEIDALQELKREFYPDAHFVITSTQPQLGHSYAPRSSISLESLVQSAEEGVLFGMARSQEDLSLVGQEDLQQIRRRYLQQLTQTDVPVRHWDFGGESEKDNVKSKNRAERLLAKLQADNIYLAFSSIRIPQNVPLVSVHTGLGAESAFVCALPLG